MMIKVSQIWGNRVLELTKLHKSAIINLNVLFGPLFT